MNTLQGSIKQRAETFIDSLPYPNSKKEECKRVFDALIQKVASRTDLSSVDLSLANVSAENAGQFVRKINTLSRSLSASSSDVSVVETVADVVYTLLHDKPFGDASESLALLLSNFFLRSANRAFMVFTAKDVNEVREAASGDKRNVLLWMANHYRDAVLHLGKIYHKDPASNNENTSYTDPQTQRRLIIQWQDLVKAELGWQ